MARAHINDIIDTLSLTYHIENTPLGVMVFDRQGHVVYWSDRASEIFGWQEEEILHKNLNDLAIIYEEEQNKVNALLEQLQYGSTHRNQSTNRNRTKDGQLIWCEWYNSALKDEEGNVTSILSMVQDVTERKDAEEALAHSEHQLSLIYNSAIDPMWLIKINEGRFYFDDINTAFTAVTGLTRDQVIGKPIEDVLPESSHPLVREKYNEALRTGKVIDYVEVAMHPAGQKVGEIRVIPVKNTEGNIENLLGIANDITEKRLLQKQLDAERDEFSRKITAAAIKGQEIERSKVSLELHDNVNQVLTTVKLYAELCASGAVDPQEVLPKCAALLNDTINEIRDLSRRLSAPSLGDIGLKETIIELADSIQATQKLSISLDTSKLTCNHVENELHLAVYRIAQEHLTNILKHAEAGKVKMGLETGQDYLKLWVKDDGKGFDPHSKSSGIGLTNMTSRAQIHGGQVELDSAPGMGCTLNVVFPIEIQNGRCFQRSTKS